MRCLCTIATSALWTSPGYPPAKVHSRPTSAARPHRRRNDPRQRSLPPAVRGRWKARLICSGHHSGHALCPPTSARCRRRRMCNNFALARAAVWRARTQAATQACLRSWKHARTLRDMVNLRAAAYVCVAGAQLQHMTPMDSLLTSLVKGRSPCGWAWPSWHLASAAQPSSYRAPPSGMCLPTRFL